MDQATSLWLSALLVAVPLAGCASPSPASPPTGSIAFETIEQGNDSGLEARETLAVRNTSAWTQLWIRHRPETDDHPKPPEVDFDERTVLALFAGANSGDCREAQITNLTGLSNATIRVEGTITDADDGRCAEQARSPYHIVEIDRYDVEVSFAIDEPEEDGRPLTATPPACWSVQAWEQPGLYEAAGQPANRSATRTANRTPGPGLAFDHADLPAEQGEIAAERIHHVAPSGHPSRFLQVSLEAADAGDRAWLRALTWAEDKPEEVAELARRFLANATSASEQRIDAWAGQLEQTQNETDAFPPTRDAVDRPPDAESDGYAYNTTIELEGVLELESLAETLDDRWRRIESDPRPYAHYWYWDANWTGAARHWSFALGLSTRILATEVNGTELVVEVGAAGDVHVHADREPTTASQALVRQGFEQLGLPEPTVDDVSHGARVC